MKQVVIIGSGVSGLVAAIELEKKGLSPILLESGDKIGGRVKTDIVNGFPLDHGFQVLLTEYPEAKKYLNYEKLGLIKFKPGSIVFKKGQKIKIGDPLRDWSFLGTALANLGSFKDKLLTLKLAAALKKKSIQQIFDDSEKTTLNYLRDFGFSTGMIQDFFRPFFAGIFLEHELNTSSRMFEFVFKMFGSGYAAIPKNGMKAIPEQLAGQLKNTTIRLETEVASIEHKTIHLRSGEKIDADSIIIATDPFAFYEKKAKNLTAWKSCYNLYFETSSASLNDPIIALLAEQDSLVNNLHFLNDVFSKVDSAEKSMISVTVVDDKNLSPEEMERKVREELKDFCGIETDALVKAFHIKKALPRLNNLKYAPTANATKLAEGIYCCGDYLANGSLNAAMASGRIATENITV